MTPVSEFAFDLDGGRACLDFVNTLSSTSGEHLNDYADLVAFVRQSALITQAEADWLRAHGQRDPARAGPLLGRARRLRQALKNIFLAVAADERAPASALELLNLELADGLAHARVQFASAQGSAYVWAWDGPDLLEAPLWPIARSAADLLTSANERPLVRECAASDCTWLFLDTSRNRTRQWCSMQSCGNREKARRHYRRLRERRAGPGAGQGGAASPRVAPAPRSAAAPSADASARAG